MNYFGQILFVLKYFEITSRSFGVSQQLNIYLQHTLREKISAMPPLGLEPTFPGLYSGVITTAPPGLAGYADNIANYRV